MEEQSCRQTGGGETMCARSENSSNPIRLSKREERQPPSLLQTLKYNSPRILPDCTFCAKPVRISPDFIFSFIFQQVGGRPKARFSLLSRGETWYQYRTVFGLAGKTVSL